MISYSDRQMLFYLPKFDLTDKIIVFIKFHHNILQLMKNYSFTTSIQNNSENSSFHLQNIDNAEQFGRKCKFTKKASHGFIILAFVATILILIMHFIFDFEPLACVFSNSEKQAGKRLLSQNDITIQNSILTSLEDNVIPRWYYHKQKEHLPSALADSKVKSKQLPNFHKYQNNRQSLNNLQTNQVELVAEITNVMLEGARGQIKSLRSKESQKQSEERAQKQYQYYEQKYQISKYKQLPICVVVPTYNNNNDDRYKLNIHSIIAQEYSNFHLVIIDDASTDDTAYLIQTQLIQSSFPKERYVLIKNEKQIKAMANLRRAAKEFCKPEDIFIIVDGDDYLLGKQVFNLYNAIFQEKKAWFMYTNFVNLNTLSIGYSRPFPQNVKTQNLYQLYRKYPFITSHLRAFYTKLFLLIKEEDLKDENGSYFQSANDVAICLPILEMSHTHVIYVPELTYGYNSNTGLNNHQLKRFQQKTNEQVIRRKAVYTPLEKLFDEQLSVNK